MRRIAWMCSMPAVVVAIVLLFSSAGAQVGTGPGLGGPRLPAGCTTGQLPTFSTVTGLWGCATAGTVSSVSVTTSAGVSGVVATATTTPAITLTLGAIAPTSVTTRYVSSGTAPSVANVGANSCGTSAAVLAGNDNAGTVTVGTFGGTQCRVTFTAAAATRWQCIVNDETSAVLARTTAVDLSNVDFLGVFGAADVLDYICVPR